MKTISRVDIGSAFRIGAVVSAILFAIFGLLWLGLQALIFAPLLSISSTEFGGTSSSFSFFASAGILSFLCFYLVGIAAAAISGGIYGAALAWAYNLAARWGGGLKVQFEADGSDLLYDLEQDMEKRKRGEI